MTPRTLLREAALAALSFAAGWSDPDFAPLIGAQVLLGQTWPSQSPPPGSAPLPNQLLLYCWEERSETVAERTTAPQFDSTMTLVVECRVETRTPAAQALLPAVPTDAAIEAAVDGALDALAYAIKKAVCQGIGPAALVLNGGPVVIDIRRVETANRFGEGGLRIAGNGAVAFELCYGEVFEPVLPNYLNEVVVLIDPQAGGFAAAGNAGNGTIGAVTVGLGAQPGAYAVALASASAFAVTAPDGSNAGNGLVGAPFAGAGIAFTLAAGTVPFAAGDNFTVAVEVAMENLITLSQGN